MKNYYIDGNKVSKLNFDTALDEAIANAVYDNSPDELDMYDYRDYADKEIDNLYKSSMEYLKKGKEITIDGIKFKMD